MQPPRLYETHSHTPLCKHATGQPWEYAAEARKKNLKGLIVTCHCPLPEGFSPGVRMRMDEFSTYCTLVDSAAEKWKGEVDVLLGMESDFLPGFEKWIEDLHKKADFHYILGSVHPQLAPYSDRFFTGDVFEFQKTYFTHLADAAETGLFDTLSHPDLIKNQTSKNWDLTALLDHIRTCLDRIAKTGVAMELNTSGINKVIQQMNPAPEILKEIKERSIPVVIGADAHTPNRVGDRFPEALALLKSIGFTSVSSFRNRIRYEISIDEAITSLSGN